MVKKLVFDHGSRPGLNRKSWQALIRPVEPQKRTRNLSGFVGEFFDGFLDGLADVDEFQTVSEIFAVQVMTADHFASGVEWRHAVTGFEMQE